MTCQILFYIYRLEKKSVFSQQQINTLNRRVNQAANTQNLLAQKCQPPSTSSMRQAKRPWGSSPTSLKNKQACNLLIAEPPNIPFITISDKILSHFTFTLQEQKCIWKVQSIVRIRCISSISGSQCSDEKRTM